MTAKATSGEAALLARSQGSRRYEWVLLMAVTAFVFEMSAPDTLTVRRIGALLQIGTLVLALWASGSTLRQRREALGVVIVCLLAVSLGATASTDTGLALTYLAGAALVGIAAAAIARGVVRAIRGAKAVTLESILGVVVVYLLIGGFFAYAFGAVAAFDPGPFFASGTDGDHADYLYFSYTTMTTVGGNLFAASGLGRSLEVLEALLGQLYLVTVMALLITNVRAGRNRTRADD